MNTLMVAYKPINMYLACHDVDASVNSGQIMDRLV